MATVIRQAKSEDAAWLQAGFDTRMGWTKPEGYFAHACQRQQDNLIVVLFAAQDDAYGGHVLVAWTPDYDYFRDNGIPEIQDLNVVPMCRRQGIATKLVDAAENLIRQRSKIAGIGFGLYADYGAAQRMYIRRGYVPDGRGVAYNHRAVTPGESLPVDDDLVLYLTRSLT